MQLTHVMHHFKIDSGKNFEMMMKVFKAHEAHRIKAGAHGHHTIFRAVDNQRDEVWIVMPWSGKKETVEEFFADKWTQEELRKGGVVESSFHCMELVEEQAEAEALVEGEGI